MIHPKDCCYLGLNNLFFLVSLRVLRGQLFSRIHNHLEEPHVKADEDLYQYRRR